MSVNTLHTFFEPQGVLVVGARRSLGFGYGLPLFLQKLGWGDRLHLVNPAGGELHGQMVYQRVRDVPAPADLAIVMVPADGVPEVMIEIGEHGIKHVIIESAGFGETGESGLDLQDRVAAIAGQYRMRVIGPNCVGVVNTGNKFCSVEVIEESLVPGPLSIIAQSGVFGNILLDHLYQYGLFISKAITLGNRLDVDESDLLEYLNHDPTTQVIMVYLEGVANGRRLKDSLSRVTLSKPVLILKSGRTPAGKQATASHTGSLSGQDRIYDALIRQTGAIRAESLSHLIELARVFATQPLPKGNRLGIITSSGSLGALATDMAVSKGLVLPNLSSSTTKQILESSPDWMNIKNPLDLGPTANYARFLPLLLSDPEIDMVLAVMVIPYAAIRNFKALGLKPKDWFGEIALLRRQFPDKPLVNVVVGHPEFVEEISVLCGPSLPVFTSPESAARALADLWRHSKRVNQNQSRGKEKI
jgi:acyl-CoA synthetase (NDP forming)